jgi:hypothetical protein
VTATLAAAVIPQSLGALDRARGASAARYLASRIVAARAQAVMRSTHVALRFDAGPSGITFAVVTDGNHNGVRSADIAAGIDPTMGSSVLLAELFPGADIAIAPVLGTDPVRIGTTNLLSMSPLGTATPGSIFVRGRDGSQFAVRVLGPTGRVRVQQYVERTGAWRDGF